MASAESVDLYVDLDELARIVDVLTRLHDQLVGMGTSTDLQLDAETAGSADVAEAVRFFLDRWATGRKELAERIGDARLFAQQAGKAYQDVENALSCASTPSGGNP